MALADLVLEGITLILVIALGLVLIGGLTYLTMTVSTANNARLAYTGLYIYLPQPIYINGTLYIPMYNIGYYQAQVRYVYVRDINGSIHRYAPNLMLNTGQYYVYALNLGYEPTSINVLVSPMNYPDIIKEFNANVSTINSIALISQALPQSNSVLISAIVNDPYNAGWQVTWSYAGQSYSISQSQPYAWYINPPYVPIQISFTASITKNPGGYECQITPSSLTNTYNAGSEQVFNVTCQETSTQPPSGSNSISVSVTNDSLGASWLVTWHDAWGSISPGSKSGSNDYDWSVNAPSGDKVYFTASITSSPSGYSCSISPTSTNANPGGSVTFTVSCTQGGSSQPPPSNTVYGCLFTLSVGSNPPISGATSSSPSPGTYFVQSGSSLSGSISAQSSISISSSSSGQQWYQFIDWTLSYSGTGTFYWNGVQSSGSWNYGKTSGSFTYDCPSGLTQNVTASFTATANYVNDYVTLSGPTSVTLNGPGTGTVNEQYTLSWNISPYSASQADWSLTTGSSYTVSVTLQTSGGSYKVSWTTNVQCSSGSLTSISESFSNGGTSLTQSVSGSSGSTSATVTITYTCSSGLH